MLKIPEGDSHFSPDIGVGTYQGFIRKLSMLLPAKADLAVDVGAHVGFWACDLASTFKKVKAFEPEEQNFICLQDNVPSNVECMNMALGKGFCRMGISNPASHNSGAWEVSGEGNVRVMPLDMFSIDPDYIKIDTQGMEADVIHGAMKTLIRAKPVVVVEMVCNGKEDNDTRNALSESGAQEFFRMGKDAIWLWQDTLADIAIDYMREQNGKYVHISDIPTRSELGYVDH